MRIELVHDSIQSIAADLLIVGWFAEDTQPAGLAGVLDEALGGAIGQLKLQGEITGKWAETTILHTFGKIPAARVAILGLGKEREFNFERLRDAAANAVKLANRTKARRVASQLFGAGQAKMDEHHLTHGFAEGAHLAAYHYEGFALQREERHRVETILLLAKPTKDLEDGLGCGTAYAVATNWARTMVNTPGNLLTPTDFAQKAIELANRNQLEYEVLDKSDMERLGMGGLLAVNQGSEQPPRLIVLKYRGRPDSNEVLGFVGKGITFDAGGISLKPAQDMDLMKTDMGGGAAVLGAMEGIARLRPNVNVIAVVPATENLPSGSAYKPGDVITTLSGKTIEVLNTDAEGRIVLADAIEYAKRLGATRIVDLATLTGAVVVALGHVTSAVMTNDEDFLHDFLKAARKAGEKVWQLPVFDEYKEQIKSDIADLKNTGGRPAGSITAALFVGAFAEDVPWIHVDIAGTAWTEKATETLEKGATGVMVRTLVKLAQHFGKHH